MEMMWPVLAVMIPLFVGGVIVLVMYWRRDPVRTAQPSHATDGSPERQPSRAPRRSLKLSPRTMALCFLGLALAVALALTVGFPLVRSLLMAFHFPIEPS
jgi:hypothetical protein